jgi:hypothetical protein
MICCSARTVGPAASRALAAAQGIRVAGVFPSTLNLEIAPSGDLVSLTGPAGSVYPHAVALEQEEDLDGWGVAAGAPAQLADGGIRIASSRGPVLLDLRRAERPLSRALAPVARLGAAHRACTARLAQLQAAAGCELRIDAVRGVMRAPSAIGRALAEAARELLAAARTGEANPAWFRPGVAALVGLGPGLTPSGDDFLSGLIAAARAAGAAAAEALGAAVGPALLRTSALSAFLIRSGLRGFWPTPLIDLAEALAADRAPPALAALDALCRLGHSSGADLAAGFLLGLECLVSASSGSPPPVAGRG